MDMGLDAEDEALINEELMEDSSELDTDTEETEDLDADTELVLMIVEEIYFQAMWIIFKRYQQEMKTYHQQQSQEQDLTMHV